MAKVMALRFSGRLSRTSRTAPVPDTRICSLMGGACDSSGPGRNPGGGSGRGQVGDRLRGGEMAALGEVDADALELIEHRAALDAFGDGGDTERPPDLADRLHHAVVDRIVVQVADELPVDLQVIDRQRLQVRERRQAGAEVIEREAAAAR